MKQYFTKDLKLFQGLCPPLGVSIFSSPLLHSTPNLFQVNNPTVTFSLCHFIISAWLLSFMYAISGPPKQNLLNVLLSPHPLQLTLLLGGDVGYYISICLLKWGNDLA